MACSRSAAPTEAIARALPFHWLLPDWPQVVIVKEWFLQRCLRASRSSLIDTWSGIFNSAKRFICLHWWAHCRRSDPKYMKAFPNVWKFSILVNIKAGGTSWPWSSEPVAAVGRCRGAPRRINFPKFWKKNKKTFVKVWSKNVFSKFGKMMRSEPFRKSLAQRCFSKFGPIFKGLIRRRIFLNSFSLKVI